MLQKCICLIIYLAAGLPVIAQQHVSAFNRAQLSVMVVPYTSKGEDVLTRIENDAGYKEAIAAINSALLNMGYRNVQDFKTHMEIVNRRRKFTAETASSELMKTYIEDAPVDILIEAEILWADPPGKPTNRQAKALLKAVDKYTGSILSSNTSVESYQREFSDLAQAVTHAITRDGSTQFTNFLKQLDTSYEIILNEGRSLSIKFEVDAESKISMIDWIDNERLSDKIEGCLRQIAYKGQFKSTGEGKTYIDYAVQTPVVDDKGYSITPSGYLRKKVDQYFHSLGIEADYSVVGGFINFLLKKNTR